MITNFPVQVFDSILDSVFLIDETGKIIYANEIASQLAGLSVKRTLKKNFFELFIFSPEKNLSFEKIKFILEQTPYQEISFQNHEAKEFTGQITIQPFTNENNNLSKQWLIYIRDVGLEEKLHNKYKTELNKKEVLIKDLENAKKELENYSKNLEQMVEERTSKIKELNILQSAMLNSLNQAFLIFNEGGECYPAYSKACLNLLETKPEGKPIWNVLNLSSEESDHFKKWMQTVFSELLPFEDLSPLAPNQFKHSQNRHIELNYYPMKQDKQIKGIVLVASDKTEEITAKFEAEKERQNVKMINSLVTNKKHFSSYAQDTLKLLSYIDQFEKDHFYNELEVNTLLRTIHTLKGGASFFYFSDLVDKIHNFETNLVEILISHKKTSKQLKNIIQKGISEVKSSFYYYLEKYQEFFGENILTKQRDIEISTTEALNLIQSIERSIPSNKIINQILSWLNVPIYNYFKPYEHIIFDLSQNTGKKIHPLVFEGKELQIFPEPYENFFSTLIHVFRNIVDHGIEAPETRIKNNKNPIGTIKVKVLKDSFGIQIQIIDDGAGIDIEKVKQSLQNKGVDTQNMTNTDLIQSIFLDQISTKNEVTLLSGRGIGLSAVKHEVDKIGGRVSVKTSKQGTTFIINLPEINRISTSQQNQAA